MNSLSLWLLPLLGLISLLPQQKQPAFAHAQYIQAVTSGWVPAPTGGSIIQAKQWRPTTNDPLQRVIDLTPELVVLEYNCFYMRDICKNAANWYATPRGQARPVPNRFTYDFMTGKKSTARNQRRRSASCGTWNSNTNCPHSDQNIIMRHDGPWQYKDLEPGTTIAEIKAKRDNQGNKIPSWVRYTCDEFPPATWIEGGNGFNSPEALADPSQSRCAAFRCNGRFSLFGLRIKVKAEQNWQATAHNVLQQTMKSMIKARPTAFPWYQDKGSVAFFEFRRTLATTNPYPGVAATVTAFSPGLANVIKPVQQAKREILAERNATLKEEHLSSEELFDLNHEAFWRWADRVTVEELKAMGPGLVSQQHILANHTEAAEMMMPQVSGMNNMPWMDFATAGEDADWNADDYHALPDVVPDVPRADPNKLKRALGNSSLPSNTTSTPRFSNATSSDLDKARKLVEEAIAKATRLNAARYANPARNQYKLMPGTLLDRRDTSDFAAPSPLLDITDELADAAALVSEAEVVGGLKSNASVVRRQAASSGTFWMEHIARMGTVSFGDSSNYTVFRNVLDYGAKGDNTQDDTKYIKLAMTDGKRCGVKCNGSTLKNAIVYFPPGTYRISSTIPMPFGTQVIGDANNPPTLAATSTFLGLGVLSSDEYTGGGVGTDGQDQSYYVNTANFYRQLRNIKIDITKTRASQGVAGLHWQVAQATSLQNVEIIATSGTKMRGIFAENGSGGSITDVTFRGGGFGMYAGSQQFTAQRLTFIGCDTGVQVIWDWGWIWKSVTMTNVGVGFRLLQETTAATAKRQTSGGNGNIASVSVVDSTFNNVNTAVLIAPRQDKVGSGSTGVIMDNVAVSGVSKVVADTSGAVLLATPASGTVKHWAVGPAYHKAGPDFSLGRKADNSFRRVPELLDSKGAYFERARPQYQDRPVGDFVHAKNFGAKGDGKTDDTAALQRALYESQGKILVLDAGSYILTGTVVVPLGCKIVGETWSQLMASGSYFQDAMNPKVMLQVGQNGDVGDIEMQDLLFTSRGSTPGLILVQWNVRGARAGSASMWDCHARLGGATGTQLTPQECPALTTGTGSVGCHAASLMMHITPLASGYFENVWLWGSDHMIDDPDLVDANNTMVQNSIYVARGFLIESVRPTWLYGTASEHAVFYQYNFNKAQNVFAGMIQTESPYFQPTPKPPAPFTETVGVFPSDPSYANCTAGKQDELGGCDESWAVIMRGCANVMIAGAGLYSWFSTYAQDCIDVHACQKVLMLLDDNHSGVRIQQLITIGAKYMAVMNGKAISALDYLNVKTHPSWSQMSLMDIDSDGALAEMFYLHPKIWEMDNPGFTCAPPCRVVIPPWTGATRTVNYPLVSVTDGTWSTTITQRPLTMTNMFFEPVTYTIPSDGNLKKRAGETSAFWPKPVKLDHWPGVTYTNKDGNVLTATPTAPFPDPPITIGPNAAAPTAGGSWPKREITLTVGILDDPEIQDAIWKECATKQNGSLDCPPWLNDLIYGHGSSGGGGAGGANDPPVPDNDDDTDEDYGDLDTFCPFECDGSHRPYINPQAICPRDEPSTTSTSTSTTTTKPAPTPTLAVGDPMTNTRECYNSGQKAVNAQMANTARSACREMGKEGTELKAEKGSGGLVALSRNYELPGNGGWAIHIQAEFNIKEGCKFVINEAQCLRYFKTVIDSCNCEGADGKQGGRMSNNCYALRLDPNTFG
ncbi:hypothetical protein ONS95_005259 [Cadophora gregata]|uniref:uncharacterized protein n=1 Tax=Cadophora gregata TaxID=51156 RepID=UPI0026DBF997|nr:uncharacterized protein ONS95_005259 [Cadophora gregata]KAK0103224.1 hypothetical protein ONS95_005259 [Cadophora gregata]KAK0107412.1 hypothetical protein ONS96_003231 [Cadophora gregata f. sp. sojae]